MRNIIKKAVAVILILCMCASFAACYSEDNLWAAKNENATLPIGGYIYYLASGYSEAQPLIADDVEVLNGVIDGQSAKDYIKQKALDYTKTFFYIADKFVEYGFEIDEEAQTTITSSTDSMWSYYQPSMEAMGVSKESFNEAYSVFNHKYNEVFYYTYGPDGDKSLSDDEIRKYYEEENFSYEQISFPITKTNEEGESEDMTDEEKAEVMATAESYKQQIEDGTITMEEAANQYMALQVLESSPYYKSTGKTATPSGDTQTAVAELKENELTIVETSTLYILTKRLPIAEEADAMLADETQKESVLSAMKSEEFRDDVNEAAKSVEGITFNDSAINLVNMNWLVTEEAKMGTSTPVESTASSDASSAVSSAANELESVPESGPETSAEE